MLAYSWGTKYILYYIDILERFGYERKRHHVCYNKGDYYRGFR